MRGERTRAQIRIPQVFISYASEDFGAAERIYRYLADRGTRPFMDKFDLVGGEEWEKALVREVRKSDFFLFCASHHSANKRGAVQREIKEALNVWREKLEEDIFFIPVRIEPCEVPENIKAFRWINLFDSDGFYRIERSIQEGLARLYGYSMVGGVAVEGKSILLAKQGCFSIDVHYPELVPTFAPDLAAINATLYSFAARLARRFERDAGLSSVEEREKIWPGGREDILNVSYRIEYIGEEVISLEFLRYVYFAGAAHGNSLTHTFNFRRHPFLELYLDDIIRADMGTTKQISDHCISALARENDELSPGVHDHAWVRRGASPSDGNFSRILLSAAGLRIIFDPYEVGPYSDGRREVLIPMEIAADLIDPEIRALVSR